MHISLNNTPNVAGDLSGWTGKKRGVVVFHLNIFLASGGWDASQNPSRGMLGVNILEHSSADLPRGNTILILIPSTKKLRDVINGIHEKLMLTLFCCT